MFAVNGLLGSHSIYLLVGICVVCIVYTLSHVALSLFIAFILMVFFLLFLRAIRIEFKDQSTIKSP